MSEYKICRLCLVQQPPISFSLLENNIVTMLEALTSKKVNLKEEVFTVVCLKCVLNLKLAYNFQQKIKKCEEKFEETVIDQLQIKQEVTICENGETKFEEAVINQLRIKQEEVTICEIGETDQKTYNDCVKLCDNYCLICGLIVEDNLINDHVRSHFDELQKCNICGGSFSSIFSYRKHLLEHSGKVTYKCSKCMAQFQYKSFYDIHIRQVCINKKRNKRTSSVDKISESIKKTAVKLRLSSSESVKLLLQTKKDEETHTCTICSKKFSSKKSFQAHTHKRKKCHICNKEISEYAYKRHIEDHTSGVQICHLCGAVLQNKSSLITHFFYSHNSMRYKCEECGKLFKKKTAKDLHIRKDHLGKPSHYCDTCGKGFYTARFLQKHIKMTHLKLRPHVCNFCNKGYSSHYALKTHQRQHTNETPYRCDICGDGFRQNVSLKAHKKSKHNITEPKTCNCKVCGKGFASDVALYAHMRLH